MIRIRFEEPQTEAWGDWKDKCKKEQKKLNRVVQGGSWPKLKREIYKGQKQEVYVNNGPPFYGKCVYCEDKIFRNQYGDVEHFRPFAGIKEENGTWVKIRKSGRLVKHPGYYWLAYCWKNLLPSCINCNRPSSRGSGGRLIGKANRFPVLGKRARRPGEETQERPLLVNPLWEEPLDHLEIDDLGIFHARTERGGACIKILALNERGLPDDRRRKYDEVRARTCLLAFDMPRDPNGPDVQRRLSELLRVRDGCEEFTAPSRKAILDAKDAFRQFLGALAPEPANGD